MFTRLRPYASIAVLALLIFYFGFQALTGERGLLAVGVRNQTLAARTAELQELRARRAELEARAQLLRDGSLSRDLLEERARSLLGLSDPRDYVIRTQPARAG